MTAAAANITANEQIVATLAITLLRCFITIGGRAELLRVGGDHPVLVDRVLLLLVRRVARRPNLARPMITVYSHCVAYESPLATSATLDTDCCRRNIGHPLIHYSHVLLGHLLLQVALTAIVGLTVYRVVDSMVMAIIIGVREHHLIHTLVTVLAVSILGRANATAQMLESLTLARAYLLKSGLKGGARSIIIRRDLGRRRVLHQRSIRAIILTIKVQVFLQIRIQERLRMLLRIV